MMPTFDPAFVPDDVASSIASRLSELEVGKPRAIYLGGSRAQGQHTVGSDYDFFIETEESRGVFECICGEAPLVHLRIGGARLIRETNAPGFAPTLHLLANSRRFSWTNDKQELIIMARQKLEKMLRDFYSETISISNDYLLMELAIAASDAEVKVGKRSRMDSRLVSAAEYQTRLNFILLAEKFYLRQLPHFDFGDVERSFFLKITRSLRFYTSEILDRHPWMTRLLELDFGRPDTTHEILSIFEMAFGVTKYDLKKATTYIHTHRGK